MHFLAAGRLWFILLPIALIVAYIVVQLRRRHHAVRFTNLPLLASVAPKRPGWRRHVPAAAVVGALVLLVLAFAQPSHQRKVARERGTVILAIDVSNSMGAKDVSPNRLAAAVDAARSFVEGLPDKLQVGLILYDGTPRVVSPPTDDHQAVANALSKAKLGPGTATGEAIITALDSIGTIDPDTQTAGAPPPAMIIVMSDGTTTVGRPDEVAVAAAKEAGVPVSTIAYGTPDGTITIEEQTIAVPADDAALQAIADGTGGQFFSATSGDQLRQVYSQIGKTVGFDVETREITATFVGFALVLLTLAAAASLFWSSRLV
jgi:Ca-activated chloride channel family protein